MKRVLLYTSPWDARPGEAVDVHVSLLDGETYDLDVMRVVSGDADGLGLDLRPTASPVDGQHRGAPQRTALGSKLVVDPAPPLGQAFAFEAWLWPTAPTAGRQVLAGQWTNDPARGWSLEIDGGELAFRVAGANGQATLRARAPLPERRWTHVRATVEPGALRVEQRTRPRPACGGAIAVARQTQTVVRIDAPELPLTIAALGDPAAGRFSTCHYDGKLARPRLLAGERVVAAWDLTPSGGRHVPDTAGSYHGLLVNLPARAVTGPDWRADSFDWRADPAQWDAVHFHRDDLHDAAWDVAHRFVVPHWPSGYYALRARAGRDTSYAPLFVLPPRGRATAPLAVLASTVTTIAYANYQFHLRVDMNEVSLGRVSVLTPEDVFLHETAELGVSTYDLHADSSPARYATRLRPVLNNQPGGEVWNLNADTHLLAWLDRSGQPYDLITDEALHAEGADLLGRYRAVVMGSHPEYFTTPMRDALEAWLGEGGRLLYLGGNGLYWRTGISAEWPGAVEVRRAGGGARHVAETPGDDHMAFTGELGGLWRQAGRAPNTLVGVGFRAIGFDGVGHYRRTPASRDPRAAWLFAGVDDEVFGADGLSGSAAGGELDAADVALGTPSHALVVAVSEGHTRAMQPAPEDILMPHPAMAAPHNPAIRADMTFFETGGGGAVFAPGSLTWPGAVAQAGSACERITTNALRRFLDPEPFVLPGGD